MGITERRNREREQRRQGILEAAWAVAEEIGWASFSVERAAARAELGRATVYGYFESLDTLIEAMAEEAVGMLSDRVADAQGLPEALDVPLRLSQQRPAAFALLFPQGDPDPRPAFSTPGLAQARAEARQILTALHRFSTRAAGPLPRDAAEAQAFLSAIAMAGVAVPELRTNTPLRRRWQEFCLTEVRQAPAEAPPGEDPTAGRRVR